VTFSAPLDRDFKKRERAWLAGNLGGYLAMERGVMELCESSLKIRSVGCTVEEARLGIPLSRCGEMWLTPRLAESEVSGAYSDPASAR